MYHRARLLQEVRALGLPRAALDDLIDQLGGTQTVAEMTGRKGRMVRSSNGKHFVFELRAKPESSEMELLNVVERNVRSSASLYVSALPLEKLLVMYMIVAPKSPALHVMSLNLTSYLRFSERALIVVLLYMHHYIRYPLSHHHLSRSRVILSAMHSTLVSPLTPRATPTLSTTPHTKPVCLTLHPTLRLVLALAFGLGVRSTQALSFR